MKKYKCKICGFCLEKESLDRNFYCPMCEVPGELFEEIKANTKSSEKNVDERYVLKDENDKSIKIYTKSKTIEKDMDKCVNCGACKEACKLQNSIDYDKEIFKIPVCIDCGKCISVCPKGALKVRNSIDKIKKELSKKGNFVIASISQAAINTILDELSKVNKNLTEQELACILKNMGFDCVSNLSIATDIYIMETAQEFVNRVKDMKKLPLIISSCVSVTKYIEIFYPELLPYLSTCKNPVSVQGTLIKTYFCKEKSINPKKIINIAIVPCIAQKYEIQKDEVSSSTKYWEVEKISDIDYTITTSELLNIIKDENIDFENIKEDTYDNMLGNSSSSVIFVNSGGAIETILRNIHYIISGRSPQGKLTCLKQVRELDYLKEATITIDKMKIKVAVIQGIENIPKLVEKIKNKELDYRIIEITNCVGSCVGGSGQPVSTNQEILNRSDKLYKLDKENKIKTGFENEDVKKIYKKFLKHANGRISNKLLHTRYTSKKHFYYN